MHDDLLVAGIVIAALILLGILFLTGRGGWLIAGYNTLPRKERERYDRRALCRFTGKLMFYCAPCCSRPTNSTREKDWASRAESGWCWVSYSH